MTIAGARRPATINAWSSLSCWRAGALALARHVRLVVCDRRRASLLMLYLKDRTTDPAAITTKWWYKTIGVLIVTFGALAAVYLTDNAWGASVPQAVLALIGSALASVGGRKLIE